MHAPPYSLYVGFKEIRIRVEKTLTVAYYVILSLFFAWVVYNVFTDVREDTEIIDSPPNPHSESK